MQVNTASANVPESVEIKYIDDEYAKAMVISRKGETKEPENKRR